MNEAGRQPQAEHEGEAGPIGGSLGPVGEAMKEPKACDPGMKARDGPCAERADEGARTRERDEAAQGSYTPLFPRRSISPILLMRR